MGVKIMPTFVTVDGALDKTAEAETKMTQTGRG